MLFRVSVVFALLGAVTIISSGRARCYSQSAYIGQWVAFTSERNGSADIYRVRIDGSGIERLIDDPAYDDQAALSPDGNNVAFVSSRGSGSTDIWILDLKTRKARNLTNSLGGDFRPSWSPDGKWLAFSSDRDTKVERKGQEWEHLHRASVYIIQADGKGLRRLTPGDKFAGSPKWSLDGKRIVFYEIAVDDTIRARGLSELLSPTVVSQIISVDVATSARQEHTSGPGLKVAPQFLSADRVGYLVKAGPRPGVAYSTSEPGVTGLMRNPAWSPDGKLFVCDVGTIRSRLRGRPLNKPLFSRNPEFELVDFRHLPAFSHDVRLAFSERLATQKQSDEASEYAIAVMDSDGANPKRIFYEKGGAALAPQWSPDGKWIVFGLGSRFTTRNRPSRVMMMRADGSEARELASGPGAGFPSFSPDGKRLLYRVWGGEERGLRILNLDDGLVTKLTTTDYDTFPGWSPAGDLIAFTSFRNGDFDIYTIRPNGTGLRQLTTAPGNDAHSSWSPDGQLMFSSSRFGFKDESPLFDGQPQPYGEIFIMKSDGTGQRPLTDNQWEDGPGAWQPAKGRN